MPEVDPLPMLNDVPGWPFLSLPAGGASPETDARQAGAPRVLIVGADRQLVSQAWQYFEEAGYQLLAAPDGASAQALVQHYPCQVAVIEASLPDMPGLLLADVLAEKSPATDCIIVTAVPGFKGASEACRRRNIIGYEARPLDRGRLLDIAGRAVEEHRARRREVMAANAAARQAGAVPGEKCYRTYAGQEQPCPHCLAPAVWGGCGPQRAEVEKADRVWDLHWVPITPDVYMHYAFDITERRRTEERYRMLFERSGDAIFLIDRRTRRCLDANQAAARLCGWTVAELRNMSIDDISPLATVERLQQLSVVEDALEPGEVTFVRPDGTQRTAWLSAVHLGGDLWYKIARDITERKQMEEALRESEHNFRNTLYNLPLGVLITGTDGEMLYGNQAVLDIFGYDSFDELKNTPINQLYTPDSYAEYLERRQRLQQGRLPPGPFSVTIVRKDGQPRHLNVFHEAVVWDGQPRYQMLYQDVTELRRAQEQLQHSQLLASLGEMTAGIAHEVNNPLGSILLYSELLLAAQVPAPMKRDLRVIHEEARRAARIMTDLLTYSRKVDSQGRRFDLHRVIRKVVGMRRYAESVQNITVTTDLAAGPLYIRGSPTQLTQVLINLFLNAEEALQEKGGGNITVTSVREGDWARITVADDGPGIPEENLKQVFFPFFTTKAVGKGTGLGLSTCYGIITRHRGLIRAENNPQGGASFIIELPLARRVRRPRRTYQMA